MINIMKGDHCEEIGTNRRIMRVKMYVDYGCVLGITLGPFDCCFKEDVLCSDECSNLREDSHIRSCWHLQLGSKYCHV
jgi:hypothetical protein